MAEARFAAETETAEAVDRCPKLLREKPQQHEAETRLSKIDWPKPDLLPKSKLPRQ